jgi:hypothetical protein
MSREAYVQAKLGRLPRCWGQILGTGLGRLRERASRVEATKKAICWPFVKPSDGLEPSTPSLPWMEEPRFPPCFSWINAASLPLRRVP